MTTGSTVCLSPGQELVQATSVGWKDGQKRLAFAHPFNDLSSPNLPGLRSGLLSFFSSTFFLYQR
jgi:hypothetical protein